MLRETIPATYTLAPQGTNEHNKGWQGVVATNLQGLPAFLVVQKVHTESHNALEWKQAYEAGGLGKYVVYGVADSFAAWIAAKLVQYGWPKPLKLDPVEEHSTATDEAVETVRVRVWEAELAYLPVKVSEKVLTARKRLRRYKNRIDLCVKILAALEGKGRKLSPAALEKTKLLLEKADQIHLKEEERLRAAEEKEREKTLQRKEKARAREEKKLQKSKLTGKKAKLQKQKKQENAQAMFMKKFVKRQSTPAKSANAVMVVELDGEEIGERTMATQDRERPGVLPFAVDRDVMSVSWWILSVMDAPALQEIDRREKPDGEQVDSARPKAEIDFPSHLINCAQRRKAAETQVHKALLEHRKSRTQHLEDRTPQFIRKRASVRGRRNGRPVKLLQFDENHRPAFFGTNSQVSGEVKPRRPFAKDSSLDYSYDSADDWEDEEEGEDILDLEVDKEKASEDAELRLLYGSDDDDDDDFLDDDDDSNDPDDVDDEDGDDSEGANTGVDYAARAEDKGYKVSTGSSPSRVDFVPRDCVAVTEAIPGSGKKKIRGPRTVGDIGPERKKRRRNSFKVVIQGISIPSPGVTSPLDCHPVTTIDGAPRITMFNPYVSHVSHYLQENSPPKPVPVRIPRTNLDDNTKLDLAVAIVTTQERTSRDAIVYRFCEERRSKGLPVPPKIEIVRAIRVLATNEKRVGDSRAGWYLNDASLIAKVRAMNLDRGQTRPAASFLVETSQLPVTNAQIVAERIADAAEKAAQQPLCTEDVSKNLKPQTLDRVLDSAAGLSAANQNGLLQRSPAGASLEDKRPVTMGTAHVKGSEGIQSASEEGEARESKCEGRMESMTQP